MAQNELSPSARVAVGTLLSAAGSALTITGFQNLLVAANALEDQSMLTTLLGLCLVFFGVTISLPPAVGVRQRIFQALAITFMALMFDWVAFVPGPREFHSGSSASHPGGPVNSTFGRVIFGIAATLMDLFAWYVWVLSVRLLRTGSEAKESAVTGSKAE